MPRLAYGRIFLPVTLWVAASLCLSAPPAIPREQEPQAKAVIPDPSLIDLQGFRDLRQQHRGKPLLVNFWATWCEPCREEYPMINELARKYAPQGLVVIGISLDDDSEITLVRRFLARTRPAFPNYRKQPGDEQAFINTVNPKWSGAIPATFFYGRDGRERTQLVGEHTREEFEQAIRTLLEPAPKNSPTSRMKNRPTVP